MLVGSFEGRLEISKFRQTSIKADSKHSCSRTVFNLKIWPSQTWKVFWEEILLNDFGRKSFKFEDYFIFKIILENFSFQNHLFIKHFYLEILFSNNYLDYELYFMNYSKFQNFILNPKKSIFLDWILFWKIKYLF